MKRSKIKDVDFEMWEKRLKRCNPFDKEDQDINRAIHETMPKSSMVYKPFRGNPIGSMDKLSLQNWANGDAGKHNFPKVEIQCLMVYVVKYGIPEWREYGYSDDEILDTLRDLGFLNASLK